MSDIAIKVENLSKQYRLGEIGTGTISRDLERWWYKVCGKEDPFLKIGETNDRTIKGESDYVWALKDINFEVKKGEVLGIIGRNGAGKSTLLKILSSTTTPTTGQIKIQGKIASLLEVGTGFHPDLSGRENIYLNGAILGMRRQEIKTKFDEIVDFAGVERYIDTPVKRYSSGMYVRLAFGVAAHLEPDILIVDEVLAVGDAEFQKKCLGKMQDVSLKEGRTVIFVSHNMNAIQDLCVNCIFLDKGFLMMQNKTTEVLKAYLKREKSQCYNADSEKKLKDIYLKNAFLNTKLIIDSGIIRLDLLIKSSIEKKISIDFRLSSGISIPIGFSSLGTLNYEEMLEIKKGENNISLELEIGNLAIGEYLISSDQVPSATKISVNKSFKLLLCVNMKD